MSSASKIVVVGISFAETDYLLRWLLRSAFREHPKVISGTQKRIPQQKIEVIDENKEKAEKISEKIKRITGIEALPIGSV